MKCPVCGKEQFYYEYCQHAFEDWYKVVEVLKKIIDDSIKYIDSPFSSYIKLKQILKGGK